MSWKSSFSIWTSSDWSAHKEGDRWVILVNHTRSNRKYDPPSVITMNQWGGTDKDSPWNVSAYASLDQLQHHNPLLACSSMQR